MNKRLHTTALALALFLSAVHADPRALEGAAETRIGTLQFENGFPSYETVAMLYNEMDFQRLNFIRWMCSLKINCDVAQAHLINQ